MPQGVTMRFRHCAMALVAALAWSSPAARGGQIPAASNAPQATEVGALGPAPPAHSSGIGLVLGGGGARGAAHIGVLKVLERERVPIAFITGTSMGAIIGSLYAAGYSPDEMEAIVGAIDWADMLDDDPARPDLPMRRKDDTLRDLLNFRLGVRDGRIQLPRGAIQGQKLLLLLRRLLLSTWQDPDFDHLPIPFRCVATDIVDGQTVVFGSGDLAVAVRASMSVPAAFAPIRVDGRLLVDGGLVNNVPIDVVKVMGATRVIAVDVGTPPLTDEQLRSPISITLQMITLVTQRLTNEILADLTDEDLLIRPELGDISSAAFDRSAEAVPLGEQGAQAMVAQLRRYSVSEADYAAWQERVRRRDFDPPLIEFVDTVTKRSQSASFVDRIVRDNAGKVLDVDRLERDIGDAYGAGQFERIVWQLKEDEDGRTGIEVLPVDKGWGPGFLTFGLQLSDDFDGRNSYQLNTEFTQTGINRYGLEWRTLLGIGRITTLRTELYQPMGGLGQFYALPYFDHRATEQPLTVESAQFAEYRVRRTRLGVEAGWNANRNHRIGIGLQRGLDKADLQIGPPDQANDIDDDSGGATLRYAFDTLDDEDFPRSGARIDVAADWYLDEFGSDNEGETLRFNADRALSSGRNNLLLGVRGSTFWGDEPFLASTGFLGGFVNLSGLTERELFGPHSLLGRGLYYRRLTNDEALFSVPAYIGASIEAGNVFDSRDDIEVDNLIYAGSVFVGVDTFFGPIFLGYGHADSGDSSFYLSFGSFVRPPN